MRIGTQVAILNSFLAACHLIIHQRFLLLIVVIATARAPLRFHPHRPFLIGVLALLPDRLRRARRSSAALDPILVHGPERMGDTQHQHHQPLLGKPGVVDQIGVDGILEVSTLVVGQQNVDRLRSGVSAIVAELRPRFG